MADTATDTTDTSSTTDTSTTTTGSTDTADTMDWKAEAEKWQGLARKHEDRAKTNAGAAKELEQLKQSSMTDIEKAVAQARNEGRAEAIKETAARVVASEIRAAAAGRLGDDQLTTLLEGINLAAFVDDDGDVDQAKVAKFVDGIAPKPDETGPAWPDLGQGARGASGKADADPLLRDIKNLAGIR